jgi:hypothetical protein
MNPLTIWARSLQKAGETFRSLAICCPFHDAREDCEICQQLARIGEEACNRAKELIDEGANFDPLEQRYERLA